MIRVFIGEDTFRSRAAYGAAREEARAKGPVVVLRDEALMPERLASAIQGQPLFGAPPVVAVEELSTLAREQTDVVLALLTDTPADRLLLIWERGKPDERLKLWKTLTAQADRVESFAPLSAGERERWIAETVRARGGAITATAVRSLLETSEQDLWALSNEIDKLLRYARGRSIVPEDVAAVTTAGTSANVFATVRALATGDGGEALRQLVRHRARGDEPRVVLSLTIREVRTLLSIRDLLDRHRPVSPWGLARDLHLPVTVAEALLTSARRSSLSNLRALFDRLVVSLYALNTGRAEPDDVLDSIALQAMRGS